MRISVRISGLDIESEAMKRAEEYFKQRGVLEELWSVVQDASPLKRPVEGRIEVATTTLTPRG